MSEIKGSEFEQTPLERTLDKIERDLNLYREDLRSVGITDQQIEAVKVKAQARVREEHELKTKQDPLNLLVEAIDKAALTDVERKIATTYRSLLSYCRPEFIVFGKRAPVLNVTDLPGHRGEYRGPQMGYYQVISLIGPVTPSPEIIQPSREFEERVLRNLGVLNEEQAVADLLTANFPRYEPDRSGKHDIPGPVKEVTHDHRGEHITIARIPTNILGIEVRLDTRQYATLDVSVSPEAARRIQPIT